MYNAFPELDPSHPQHFLKPQSSIEKRQAVSAKPPEESTVINSLIIEILAKSTYSLRQIAKETAIPLQTIYRLYNGTTKNPNIRIFHKIMVLYCRVCQV